MSEAAPADVAVAASGTVVPEPPPPVRWVDRLHGVRWYAIAALSVLTAGVLLLDATGVIFDGEDPASVPALVVDPPAVEPAMPAFDPVTDTAPDDAAALARSLRRALRDPALGPQVRVLVTALDGTVVVSDGPEAAAAPASTLKLLTALAVLDRLGGDTVIETRVVTGSTADEVVLVGGGDATLATAPDGTGAATLVALARRTAAELRASGLDRVSVAYDTSLFTGPAVSPDWEPTYVTSGVIAPVTALMVDQGLVDPSTGTLARESDPAEAAAREFARLLGDRGVQVVGRPKQGTAEPEAPVVAAVASRPTAELVRRMLTDSDNQLAEALGRLAALESGEEASFAGAGATLLSVAADRGIDVTEAVVEDASGLARGNRLAAEALVAVLAAATEDEVLRPLLDGLPIGGLTGTLSDRYLSGAAAAGAGLVRAKTGTLTGVSAEAGMVTTCDGHGLLFAFLADRVAWDTESARAALDEAAAVLTGC